MHVSECISAHVVLLGVISCYELAPVDNPVSHVSITRFAATVTYLL